MTGKDFASAVDIAGRVKAGTTTAVSVTRATLARIDAENPRLNAFTAVTAERALATAASVDSALAAGKTLPLAGVPFAVKNLFDVVGLPTLAGSKINRDCPPATRDAPLIRLLEAAGAVLVGTLNMGEYAYDFTGENAHDGATRNPHDITRMAGGSSSGTGAAVAGGLVPIGLGSDTNGSIRVPASFCGIFGLKPTYGRLPRTGTFPFVTSLDHVGPMARTATDLALAYDAMQGFDADDPVCSQRPVSPTAALLDQGIEGLRIGTAGGYFLHGASDEARSALARVATALGADRTIDIPDAAVARMAAFLITASESGSLHLDRLRRRAADFDPAVRDRLIAGSMLPGSIVVRAQKFRRWFRDRMLEIFQGVDVIVAPATPTVAPRIGQTTIDLAGETLPLRPNIGVYTQPFSFIGLPVVAVPVPLAPLPIGVQIITAPGREDIALRVARRLELSGICTALPPLGI